MANPRVANTDLFWAKVDKSGECWLWTGCEKKKGRGYGAYTFRGERQRPAHRIAYELAIGPIPNGLFVCHRCDNPRCVRPEHLFLGTPRDNMRDKMDKGRHRFVVNGVHGERHGKSKLTVSTVQAIRKEYEERSANEYQLAGRYGVSQCCIHNVVRRKTWKEVP